MIKKSRNNLIHDGYSTLSHLLLKRKALFVFTFIFINLALLPSALATSDSYNTCETALYVDPQEETYVVHQDTLNYSNDDHDVYKVITTKAGEIELQISRRGGTSNEPTVIWSIYKNSCTLNNRLYSQTVDLDSDGDIYDIWTSEQDADPTTYYIDIGIVLPRDSTDAPYDFVIYFDPYVTCDPPGKAVNPNPSDGATGVQLNPSLSWTNGGGATSYAVYFGTSSLLGSSDYQTIVTSPTWRPPSPLQEDTTYYWRIDAKNNCPSGTTEGNIWSFTTLINNVPPTVEITEPSANITVDVGELVQIAWNGTDPDDNASVVLYRDPDQTYNNGNETIIISGQPEDGSKSWDTSGTPLGEYYILAKICDDEPSCSYAYSTGTVSIVGKPDFEPNTPSLEPDSNVSPGESLRVKGRIYNYGQITAPAAEHVILLNDIRDSANFTMRSIPLGKITTGSIAPGQYEEYDKIFEAPLILASGWDYFIVIACDYADLITEEHDGEDSNNRFAPLFGVPDHREAQLGTSGNSSFSGDPVNTALGNFTEQRTDLVIPGRGLNVTFTRYYNSQGGLDSPMGFYWNHSYNIYVHEDVEDSSPTGNYTVVYGDGRRHKYTPNGSGGYDPPVGVYATFIKNPDNSFTVTQKDQVKYNFDASGRLTSIKDRNNNTISFTYTGNNLTGITDTVGRQVSIQYNNIGGADRIISIQGPVRPAVIYGYDSYGNLTSVADARNNTTQYVYDPNHDDKHLLTKIVNVRGKEEIKNFYGKADGTENTEATPMGSFGYFVVRQQDADNKNTYYTYNLNDKVTTITGPDGEATEHHYDDHYRFVKEVDPNGDFVQFVYDENGNRTSVRDKMGRITSYTYDDRGNILTKTDPPVAPAATGVVTRIEYNDFNDPLKKTEAYGILNYEWNYTYDAKGNLETETDPEGNQTSYDYNSYGQLTGKTDANEKTTSYFYEDTYKNLTKVTGPAPSNCVTRHTYDDAGRKLTATDGLGNVTTYHYDNNDNLDWVEDGEGNRTNYGYDENNNRTSLQNARGYTTAYIYDNKDRLTIVRNPLDQEVTTYYDAFDRKERVIDQWGNLTRFEYDKVGNLSKVTNAKDEVTTYGYDKNGNKTDMWQPGVSEPWEYQFDEMNRLVWEEDPLNNRTSYEYNQMGWITNVTDAELRDTRFEYYKNGKLKRVIDPDQGETVCTYDPVGNRLTEQDARQNTITYEYDEMNRLKKIIDRNIHLRLYEPEGKINGQRGICWDCQLQRL